MNHQFTLAVAESLTGGLLSDQFVRISGASRNFCGSVTTYSLESKVTLLGTDKEMTYATNGVSHQVARQMALGVCKMFRTDIGIATTGYAEEFSDNRRTYYQQAHVYLHHATSGKNKSMYLVSTKNLSRNNFRRYVAQQTWKMYHEYVNHLSADTKKIV